MTLLKGLRFVAVMLAALTLAMGICHLMQLPARMGWDQYLWVGSTVQGGLYHLFGSIGAIIGLAEGIVIVGASTYLVLALRVDASLMTWLGSSTVAKYCETIFFKLLGFLL